MLAFNLQQKLLRRNLLVMQCRTLIFKNPAKNKRRTRATRQRKREKALLSRDWPIKVGDRVFVLDPTLIVNPEMLSSREATKFLSPDGNDISTIGETGEVLELHKLEDCVTVSNVNVSVADIYDIYTGQKDEEARPRPIAYSRIFLLDPIDQLPTLTNYMFDPDTGNKFRVSARSGEIVPWPDKVSKNETFPVDTLPEDALEDTYSTDDFDLNARLEILDKETAERKAIRLEKNKIYYAEKEIIYQEWKEKKDTMDAAETKRLNDKKEKKEAEKKERRRLKYIRWQAKAEKTQRKKKKKSA